MVDISIENRKEIVPLFEGWEETMVWSCLQGQMGRAWADRTEHPAAAQIAIGDLIFLAGAADAPGAAELAGHLPVPKETRCPVALLVPQNEAWAGLIEAVHGPRARRGLRYAIKKEPDIFDRAKLQAFCEAIPEGFQLKPIDRDIYGRTKEQDFTFDYCSQFDSYEDYRERGIGYVAMRGNEIAAGASSYTVYNGGIEIEISTGEEYRRQGLALACGAALILGCLERGLYPSWDAANLASVALAEKLGYHFDKEYPYYAVSRG